MYQKMKNVVVLAALLLLSACGGGFEPGDKVIVVTDYDEVRIGYMVGKFVSEKNDKINVEIRKFKELPNKYRNELTKGDEESYPSDQVYAYEEGRVVVNARKKFFKKMNKLDVILAPVNLFNNPKALKHAVKKIKLDKEKLAALQALAEVGKLKEWQQVVPMLQQVVAAKSSDADSLDALAGAWKDGVSTMNKQEDALMEVYRTMPYVGDATGRSNLAQFVQRAYAAPMSIYAMKERSLAKKNKNKHADANAIRQELDRGKDVEKIGLKVGLRVLKIMNTYNDGQYDDDIERTQDKLDTFDDDHSTFDKAARNFLKEHLADQKMYKISQKDSLKQLRKDIDTLGSSEENLEIDLNDLLDQAYSSYALGETLEQNRWQGILKINSYRRHFSKKVRWSKVKLTPGVAYGMEKIMFQGTSSFTLSDGDGRNIQRSDAALTIDDESSFTLTPNIQGRYHFKCNLTENREIHCVTANKSASLTLFTKDQRAEHRAKEKQKKKADKEAARAASLEEKHMTKKTRPVAAPIAIIGPDASTQKKDSFAAPSSFGQAASKASKSPTSHRLSSADSRALDRGVRKLQALL